VSRKDDHDVPRSTLDRFAAGDASPAEREAVLRHLVKRCAICRRHLRLAGWHSGRREMRHTLGNVVPVGPRAGTYDEAFAAARCMTMSALDREHVGVKDLLTEIEGMSEEEREFKVRNLRRYAEGKLALALVDRSFELRYSEPEKMLEYARLAVAVAEAATPETAGGHSMLADCRARAWAQFGMAQRARGKLVEAERSFAAANRHLDAGSGEAEPRAWVAVGMAALRTAQRAFQEAIALDEEAATLFRKLNDRTGESIALIGGAWARIASADPEPAIAPLHRALEILNPWASSEQKLVRAAALNLVLCYIDVGRPRDAYNTASLVEPYFEDCTDELVRLRWTWQRGNIDRDMGLLFSAQVRLARVRDGFEFEGLAEEMAEVSLDLAMVYVRQRRRADYLRTISDAAAIFGALGTTRELLGALGQLSRMAHEESAATTLLRRLLIQCRGGVPRVEA
jgi:tetratricopeptide (TPR) repeat protein